MGFEKDKIVILRSGDVLELSEDSAKDVDKVPCQSVYVDGLGVGDVGNSVLKDRQRLSESGVVIASIVVDEYSGTMIAGPDVYTRGCIYEKESEEILEGARRELTKALNSAFDRNVFDWGKLKTIMKDTLSEYFWRTNKRRPVIVPIISGV